MLGNTMLWNSPATSAPMTSTGYNVLQGFPSIPKTEPFMGSYGQGSQNLIPTISQTTPQEGHYALSPLPPIPLPKLRNHSDFGSWHPRFISQIHLRPIPDDQKMYHLIESMEGEARQFIKKFYPSGMLPRCPKGHDH
ncbi:hypothetical protein L596_000397 [Steinernema carpocapsae]|uniref:Uncharacterized protein n=1 Tax=Steinernema carpocapsae TaxID=34508 RepID=A0A4U8UKA1_STECR|nr:hypothetical protein L596_000397 [Steinernema carpocapsae]